MNTINQINRQATQTAKNVQNQTSQSAKAQPEASPAQSDSVTLTQAGSQMVQIEQQIQNAPAIDLQKVQEIKDAIASGSYRVDSQKVAEQLVALEKEQYLG